MIYSPQATHEGSKSHNHELKANNRLIFTLTRIPQGAQKYSDDKCIYFLFSFLFLTIHGDIYWC